MMNLVDASTPTSTQTSTMQTTQDNFHLPASDLDVKQVTHVTPHWRHYFTPS